MLQTRAVVVRVDGADVIVESRQAGGCGQCKGGGSCGSSSLSRLARTNSCSLRIRNTISAREGDEIEIAVADGVLLHSALLLYALPLALLFVGGFAGAWAGGDAAAAAGALIGVSSGLLWVRSRAARGRQPEWVISSARGQSAP